MMQLLTQRARYLTGAALATLLLLGGCSKPWLRVTVTVEIATTQPATQPVE